MFTETKLTLNIENMVPIEEGYFIYGHPVGVATAFAFHSNAIFTEGLGSNNNGLD